MNVCVVIILVCLFQGLFLCWKDIVQEMFSGLVANETYFSSNDSFVFYYRCH